MASRAETANRARKRVDFGVNILRYGERLGTVFVVARLAKKGKSAVKESGMGCCANGKERDAKERL